MTATAFSSPSGGYPLVSRRGYNATNPSQGTATPTYWRSAGTVAGLVLAGFAAVVGGAVYPMAWATTAGGVRSLVLAIAAVLAALAGVTLIAAWQDRRNEVRQHRIAARFADEIRTLVQTLSHTASDRRQQLEELERMPRRMQVLLEAHERHQAELLLAVREEVRRTAAAVDERITAVEQRVDRVDAVPQQLLSWTRWAAQIDHRLAEVQTCLPSRGPDGCDGGQPMEMSDEALRGYFLGFYDRERDQGASGGT